jgi:PDZ domain-containing protein
VKRTLTPVRLALGGLALLVVAALVLWLAPSDSYLLLPDTARRVSPLVHVPKNRAKGDDKGELFFLAVLVRKANLLERLIPAVRDDGATLVPAAALRPPGVSESAQRKIDEHDMSQSQSLAAAVALKQLGYKVLEQRNGAEIAEVVPGTPAVGKLKPSDVIVSVDGRPVRGPIELRRLIRRH